MKVENELHEVPPMTKQETYTNVKLNLINSSSNDFLLMENLPPNSA